MRFLIVTLVLLAGVATFAANRDALWGSTSPTKRHEVVLDAAAGTPLLLVRELPSHRVVGRLEWPGDPSGRDFQELRTHAQVLWHPAGKAVAINTDEGFYAYTSVLARQSNSDKFVQVPFPDYKSLTRFSEPNPDHLCPRRFARSVRWTPDGHLVYYIAYSPDASYHGPDPLSHSITLSLTPTGMKVVRREANPKDAVKIRTLDAGPTSAATLSEALSEVAASYKRKYGDDLPIYVSIDLPLKPLMSAVQLPVDADGRPKYGVFFRITNAPVSEILRIYGIGYDAQVSIREGLILFHKSPPQSPQRKPKRPAGAPEIPGLEDFYEPCVNH